MLAKQHRLTAPQDFSAVMRRGARAGTSTVVIAVLIRRSSSVQQLTTQAGRGWRCGFIVSKAVGNAVVRHRTTRRLRHIVRDLIESGGITLPQDAQCEIVIRALAESAMADHPSLSADVASGLRRAAVKAGGGPGP